MVFVARWIRNIVVGFAIYVAAVVSTGAVMAYGCISRIDDTQVLAATERAYFERVTNSRPSGDDGLQFVICAQPESVVDYFYGIPLGWEWQAHCSYEKAGQLIAEHIFHINECRTTRLWQSNIS
ncbi:hypothetical protein [Agrobacterium tumefaciens]|uniref:hypothetical protein n=1 Tax=Agrobacterium tumefaciens TaxID=358 RepID=UPI000EF2536B|nr:hypothetical protein [Agrobacterium tumefaciens]AYM05639.1 hypothetical protein At1D1460_13970 [Agrobacterium tumefaciens]NSZ32469.1 hypothetical protein [Agrobacterium tumefaciens]QLG22094.1 hypothetical protein EML4_07060 [Agrobacterium tumefaciens]UXS85985.1 hypothetical protein FY144_07035 [Agrobacterium tumefaciens]